MKLYVYIYLTEQIMDVDTVTSRRDNNIQDIKNYAVVKFLSDCTFSEIATAWLYKEGDMQQCW